MNTRVCSICGNEKECITVPFIPVAGKDTVNPKPYTGARDVTIPGEFICTPARTAPGKRASDG